MKNILKIILILIVSMSFLGILNNYTYAEQIDYGNNLNIPNNGQAGDVKNDYLNDFQGENDFNVSTGGEKGAQYAIINLAKDLKNVFFIIATLFLMVLVLKLLFTENTEEQASKFKKGIIWTTLGIIVMQGALAFVETLYDKPIGESVAFDFIDNIVNPIIGLIEILASVFFLGIAIFAFFRLTTAHGDEEKVKSGKMTIAYAIIGFIIIRISKIIVEGVYGKINCHTEVGGVIDIHTTCIDKGDVQGLAGTFMHIINWMNGFVGLIVVLLIIYTGFKVILSSGDEDTLKKAKSSMIYIAIGLALLAMNYLILTFFILPEVQI